MIAHKVLYENRTEEQQISKSRQLRHTARIKTWAVSVEMEIAGFIAASEFELRKQLDNKRTNKRLSELGEKTLCKVWNISVSGENG